MGCAVLLPWQPVRACARRSAGPVRRSAVSAFALGRPAKVRCVSLQRARRAAVGMSGPVRAPHSRSSRQSAARGSALAQTRAPDRHLRRPGILSRYHLRPRRQQLQRLGAYAGDQASRYPAVLRDQRQLNGTGSVTCKILWMARSSRKLTATGGYNIADCEISPDPFSGK